MNKEKELTDEELVKKNHKEALDLIFKNYVEAVAEKASIESKFLNLERLVKESYLIIEKEDRSGELPLEISGHAVKSILIRLQKLTAENPDIYKDVMNVANPQASLLWENNLEAFILSSILKSRENCTFSSRKSNNGDGLEYHYDVEIKNWSKEKKCIFTAVVEAGNIKTGYFNWKDNL